MGERFKPDLKNAKKVFGDFLRHEGHLDTSPQVEIKEILRTLGEFAKSFARAGVISGSIMSGTAGIAKAENIQHPHAHHGHTQESFVTPHHESAAETHLLDEHDVDLLALNAYFEAGGEHSLQGQMATIFVPLLRAVSMKQTKWEDNIKKVLFAKYQFSWTSEKNKTFETVQSEKDFKEMQKMVREVFLGKPIGDVILALSEFTHLPLDAKFYKRTDVQNADFDELTPVGTIEHHTFYAERVKDAPSIVPDKGAGIPLPRERPKDLGKIEKQARN